MNGVKAAELVGREIDEVWVAPDEHALAILCADGAVFLMDTEADCCSESWWADAIGIKQLLGGTVAKVEDVDLPDPADGRTRQESDEAYGFRVTTDRGVCDLIFRNSSNGYYGGWAHFSWRDEVPEHYRQITEDWSA